MGNWAAQDDQRLRDPERPEHRWGCAACPADRVRRLDPDEFFKTTDTCTGMSIRRRASARSTSVSRRPCASRALGDTAAVDNTTAGSHVAFLSGVGTAASGGGGTGPQDRPARPVPLARRARTERPARRGPRGTNGTDGRSGATGPQGPRERRGRPGRAARRAVTRRCAASRQALARRAASRSPARCASPRGSPARRCACGWSAGTRVYATARGTVKKGRVAIRVRPRARLQHARYRAPAHLRRPQGPGDDRLAAGEGEPLGRRSAFAASCPQAASMSLPARQPHRRAQAVRLERRLERVDRAAARAVVDRAGRVVRDQVELVDPRVEQLRELRPPGRRSR